MFLLKVLSFLLNFFRELVHHGTMDAIVKAYQVIYDKVIDQHNLYEEPFMIVGKTVEQIKQLLM